MLALDIAPERNVFFYVISGKVNGQTAEGHSLVEVNNDRSALEVEAASDAALLVGHALPFNEPVVAQGPLVMNTEEEIRQAYADY